MNFELINKTVCLCGKRHSGKSELIKYKTEQKTIKTTNDKRGSKTITLHQKAKEYRILHPELSYRNCLIEGSKQEPQQEIKPELIEVEQEPEQECKNTIEICEENICI